MTDAPPAEEFDKKTMLDSSIGTTNFKEVKSGTREHDESNPGGGFTRRHPVNSAA